jgi:hypothetical protein
MPRIELRDGQWAELREHITHAEDKAIRRAQWLSRSDPDNNAGAGDTVALKAFIKAWSVNDPDGNAITLGDADAIDRMPSDIADAIALQVNELYHPAATVPNAPTPPSSAV